MKKPRTSGLQDITNAEDINTLKAYRNGGAKSPI